MKEIQELIDKIGYKEFVIQLIQYEKPRYTRKLAEKIYKEFMEQDFYTSLFDIEGLCEEYNSENYGVCIIYLDEEHHDIDNLSPILQDEYLDIIYDELIRVTSNYYIGIIDDAVESNIYINRN